MLFTTINQLLEQGVQNAEIKQGFQIECFGKTFRRDSDLPKKFRDQAISRCQENIKSGLSSFIVETKLYLTVWKEEQKQQPNEEISCQSPNTQKSAHQITQQLLSIRQSKFTGKLEVRSLERTQTWYLYLCLGRLIWADGGCHTHRSWQRCLLNCNLQIPATLRNEKAKIATIACGKYYFLRLLIDRGLISKTKAITIIQNKITEVLFDIIQQEQQQKLEYTRQGENLELLLQDGLNLSTTLISVEEALVKAQKEWLLWSQHGLKNWSPNLAPVIREFEQLKEQLPNGIYQRFTKLFHGELSLRDLAIYMNQDLVSIGSSLSPYIHRQWLELIKIPDLEPFTPLPFPQQATTNQQANNNRPLIACIDDSPQACQIMKQIFTKAKYGFIDIQKPLEAIPQLINSNPSFIFLDLTMPIVNGYELCAQIRRVSQLKDVPVVMLTSSDGIVDRVRAKMVHASGFLAKPIREDKVIKAVEKMLGANTASPVVRKNKPRSNGAETFQYRPIAHQA